MKKIWVFILVLVFCFFISAELEGLKKALELSEDLSSSKGQRALLRVARMYLKGQGGAPLDLEKAGDFYIKYYELLAKMDYSLAQRKAYNHARSLEGRYSDISRRLIEFSKQHCAKGF